MGGLQFVKTKGETIAAPYEYTTMVEVERADDPSDKHFMVHSYYNKRPALSVFKEAEAISGNGTNLIEYAATENGLRIYVADTTNFEQGRSLMLAGDTGLRGDLNGRSLVISSVTPAVGNGAGANAGYIDVSTSGLAVADENFNITVGTATDIFALTSPAANEPTMEAFFEGTSPVYEGAKEIYSSQKIVMREIQSSTSNTTDKGAFVASAWKIDNTADEINGATALATKLTSLGLQNFHRQLIVTEPAAAGLAQNDTMNIVLSSGTGTANDLTVATGALANGNAGTPMAQMVTALNGTSDLMGYSFTFVNAAGEVVADTTASNWRNVGATVANKNPAPNDTVITKMFV